MTGFALAINSRVSRTTGIRHLGREKGRGGVVREPQSQAKKLDRIFTFLCHLTKYAVPTPPKVTTRHEAETEPANQPAQSSPSLPPLPPANNTIARTHLACARLRNKPIDWVHEQSRAAAPGYGQGSDLERDDASNGAVNVNVNMNITYIISPSLIPKSQSEAHTSETEEDELE
jgi:hypothetical protein